MPTDRDTLSRRTRQPGHDRSWLGSERRFESVARALLPARYEVVSKPKDLLGLFEGTHGFEPEAKIVDSLTGRYVYVEVKRQMSAGNAEERVFKYFTAKLYDRLAGETGFDYHPVVAVFCDRLAVNKRYLVKFRGLIDEEHWVAWRDYDPVVLGRFLDCWRSRLSGGADTGVSSEALAELMAAETAGPTVPACEHLPLL